MQPGWLSFGLSCVLAIIALASSFALLRFKAENQETQVKEVKGDISSLKKEFAELKDEVRNKLNELSSAVKLASTEQAAVNKIVAEGMSAIMKTVDKIDNRVHELETREKNGNS